VYSKDILKKHAFYNKKGFFRGQKVNGGYAKKRKKARISRTFRQIKFTWQLMAYLAT